MKNRLFSGFAGIVSLALLLAGCGGQPASEQASAGKETSATPAAAAKKQFLVGFSNSSLNHPWRIAIQKAIETEAAKYPDIKLISTEAKEQPAKQLSDVEDMLAQKIDLLLVCTVKGETFAPAVDEVKRAGIPLIPVDRNILTDDYRCFVGQSNLAIGSRVADYVADELKKKYGEAKGKVVEICGVAGDVPSDHRKKGFHDRVAEAYPGIEIIASQNTDYTRVKSMNVMENLLQAHPQIDVVYTHEDEIALGAIEALKAANRMQGVITIGNGGSGAALESIKKGEMTACATYSPIDAGTIGMRAAAKILHGEAVPKIVPLEGAIVTKDNLDKTYIPGMKSAEYVYTVDLKSMDLPVAAAQK